MAVRFVSPWMLVLLVPVLGFVFLLARRLGALSAGRRRAVLGLRATIVVLLVLGLAETELTWQSDRLTVFFVLDASDSVAPGERERALELVNRSSGSMGPRDWAGMVVFGRRASLERAPQQTWDTGRIQSAPGEENTDLSAGLRLALAAFPEFTRKRIVLLSDGNQNSGDAVEVARMARANGAEIDIYPLRTRMEKEVLLDKIETPHLVQLDKPFELRVLARSEEDTTARLIVLQDGSVAADQSVELRSGDANAFSLTVNLTEPGFYKFEALLETEEDTNPRNNQVYGFTYAGGEPRILFADSEPDQAQFLLGALAAESIPADVVAPEEIPADLAELNIYDSVVVSNVPMERLSPDQMRAIERCVHEMGVGLVMIGGPDSFGAGGYLNTPIEAALPVNMDITQKRVLPKGALVVILHAVEIPQGNTWAKRVARAAVDVLGRRDEFGYITYDYGPQGDFWVVPLQEVRSRERIKRMIDEAATGDMPAFDPGLQLAYESLRKSDAAIKHIVVLSDADPQPWTRNVVDPIVEAGITISAYAINPHSGSSLGVMERLADLGKGNYQLIADPSRLPRIFVKEAKTVTRSLIIEKPFVPVEAGFSEVLLGISDGFPTLLGYVATEPKEPAQMALITPEKDPLLGQWRYGLGKAVAFTSDAKPRWARDWHQWDRFGQFWSQLVRWSMRSLESRNLLVQTVIEGNTGTVIVDAIDDEGRLRTLLDVTGSVVMPDYETVAIALAQTQPGRYEGSFDARKEGVYMVTVEARGGGGEPEVITTGAVLPYSLEYRATSPNLGLLNRIARMSGGREISDPGQVFAHDLPAERRPEPIWSACIAAALLLFPLDILLRRVMVGMPDAARALARAWRWVRARALARRAVTVPDERMAALRQAKARAIEPAVRTRLEDEIASSAEAMDQPVELFPGEPGPRAAAEPEPERPPVTVEKRFTSQLLDAKKRAAERMRRRKGNDDES